MFQRRIAPPSKTSASTATVFDLVTIATFVVTAAVVSGTMIGYGPTAAADHIRSVLAGLAGPPSSDLDPDIASRVLSFGISTCPMAPLCVTR